MQEKQRRTAASRDAVNGDAVNGVGEGRGNLEHGVDVRTR